MRAALPRWISRLAALSLAACLTPLLGPGAARAVVSDVRLVDGPGADVVQAGDAAMSEDGTGGVVYLKEVDGHSHVFAAQFAGGAWGPPRRVDVGQGFDSSWPRIGAGDGGRLLVTWVQEFGVESDRMFSATMDPGATSFQPPVPLDLNVGEATSTYPDLAMNRGGQAYLAYRVVTDVSPSNPDGYIGADLRVARYGARLWSVLGTPIDRNVATPVREPSAENAPEVGIDIQGQGVVAWQEPDDEFVDRVWVRRLFGSSVGIPIQASPSSWEGAPLRGAADAFSLDVAGFGQTAVAFRQQPGQASKLTAPRSMVNEMPDVFSGSAQRFAGAQLADGGARGALGPPSVAVDPRGLYLSGFAEGPATLLARGDEAAPIGVARLDEGRSGIPGNPMVDLAESGAGVAAWAEQQGATGLVVAQERRADGIDESTALSAPAGGAVADLVLGGSGLGDAIVLWRQGSDANSQLAAAVVDAPPDPFLVLLPNGWQRKKKVRIAWDQSPNAIGGVRYSVSVDDEPVREGLRTLGATLKAGDLANGRHKIQIFATDDLGQETGSRTGRLLVDRQPPQVKLRRKGRRLTAVVTDGGRKIASTLRKRSVKISFGEGGGAGASASAAARGRGRKGRAPTVRASHTYTGSGRFRIRVSARDRAGNRTSWTKVVRMK